MDAQGPLAARHDQPCFVRLQYRARLALAMFFNRGAGDFEEPRRGSFRPGR